jgi:hypothetical protein
MYHRRTTVVMLVAGAACGGNDVHPDAVAGDALVDTAGDASAGCTGGVCDVICDPADTWLAVTRGPGTGLGDADPASPDEVGDGLWHLFVGVNDSTTSTPDVYIYDATGSTPDGAFTLPASPLVMTHDSYDVLGIETPSYLRVDAHREYVYYCAIESYAPLSASVAALRRTDGGAWTKLGPVAPKLTGELTQCEATVVRDRASGELVLSYLALNTANGSRAQQVIRRSTDPETFPTSTVSLDHDAAAPYPARLAISFDPISSVYRTAFDVGYPSATQTLQTWSASPAASEAELAAAGVLHDGNHAVHENLHVDGTSCTPQTCPQGAVLQPSKAIYPNATDVIFYYSGWSNTPALQVNGQRCHRRS